MSRYKHHTVTKRGFVVIERDGKETDILVEVTDLKTGDAHYILDPGIDGTSVPFQAYSGNNVFIVSDPARQKPDGTYVYNVQDDMQYFDPRISDVYLQDYLKQNKPQPAKSTIMTKPTPRRR